MNSLWLRQLSPSTSKSLNTVSSTFSESSWPVAIVTARLNWAVGRRKKKNLCLEDWKKTTDWSNRQRNRTHAHRTVGFCDHFHWEGKIFQVVGEQAEGFELIECDTLQKKTWQLTFRPQQILFWRHRVEEACLYLTRRYLLPHVFPVDFIVFFVGVV